MVLGGSSLPIGFLTKYGFGGGVLWNDTFGSPDGSGAGPSFLSADSSGVYLSMVSGVSNGFVMKYDSSRSHVWSFQTPSRPSRGSNLGNFLVAIGNSMVYLAGATGAFYRSEGLVQSFSSSPSLIFFGVNPPYSFVLIGALIGVAVLSGFLLTRRYLRIMSKRPRSASPDRHRKPGNAPAD